ncbi:MAG TPA: MFS transporter [Streptosporangiaceae bacterium]|nr:MFS transporter [Streptosporangiaceae bacterium]
MRKWLPLTAVCLGTFMLLVDVTIVTVALPGMAAGLSASFSALQWVVDGYALALAALLLTAGAVADRYGRRAVYLAGLAVFAAASAACGLATGAPLLVASRVVQGAAAAAMYATTIALLNSAYTGRDRGVAYGVWGAVSGAAAAAGPLLGGILTQGLSWRWIFFVNLPVCAAAIAATLRAFTGGRPAHLAGPGRGPLPRLDVPGAVAFTAAAAAVTGGLIRAAEDGWGGGLVTGLLASGAVLFVLFVLIERRCPDPLLDLSLLRRPAFAAALVTALLMNAAAFAYLPYTSLWLQTVVGLGPIRAGLAGTAPLALAAFVLSALIGRWLHAANPRWLVGGGMLLIGVGALLQSRLYAQSGGMALVPGLIVAGAGVGLATAALVSYAMAAVPRRSGGMAAGAVNTARQLGFTFGVAVVGSVFADRLASHLAAAGHTSSALAQAVAGGQTRAVLAHTPAASRAGVETAVRAASAYGLQIGLLVAGGLGLAGGIVALAALRKHPVAEPDADQVPAAEPVPEPGARL